MLVKLNLIFDKGDGAFQKKILMCTLGEHFRRYAHALRFAVGLPDTQKFQPIVKFIHYQISSGARTSLKVNRFMFIYEGLKLFCGAWKFLKGSEIFSRGHWRIKGAKGVLHPPPPSKLIRVYSKLEVADQQSCVSNLSYMKLSSVKEQQ